MVWCAAVLGDAAAEGGAASPGGDNGALGSIAAAVLCAGAAARATGSGCAALDAASRVARDCRTTGDGSFTGVIGGGDGAAIGFGGSGCMTGAGCDRRTGSTGAGDGVSTSSGDLPGCVAGIASTGLCPVAAGASTGRWGGARSETLIGPSSVPAVKPVPLLRRCPMSEWVSA